MTLLERPPSALSAQQVDPLSWVTGPYVPLVFGFLSLGYGIVMGFVTYPEVHQPGAQFVAAALCGLACLTVHVATRPMRPPLGWAGAIVALLIGTGALLLSALGCIGGRISIEQWWAPIGFAFVVASLAPYLPARRILGLGGVAAAVAVPVAYVAVAPKVPFWGPVSIVVLIASPIAAGVIGAATFSYAVVRRMVPMLERRSQVLVSLDAARSAAAQQAERRRVADMNARVVPFLERIAVAGRVDAGDRVLAGQIARQLRDDLVARSNLSWLDQVARTGPIVVVDPGRRAERMSPSQRAALRGLIRAILETPGADSGSVLVELRGQEDGSTAVALSLDVDLPEGRRNMHLAPYYLTLRTAVRDLRWEDVRRLRFEVPPDSAGAAPTSR